VHFPERTLIVILGLIIVVAAALAGVAGVAGNGGSAHTLTHGFSVLGYHVTGSAGTLFLYGIVVGAVAVAGLGLLLAGARRASRRGRDARRGLKQSRRETAAVTQERDDLIDQREAARAETPTAEENGSHNGDRHPGPDDGLQKSLYLFGYRSAARQDVAAAHQQSLNGQPAADAPADEPAPAE
jgi:Sec-independent protein translocase protein TatA